MKRRNLTLFLSVLMLATPLLGVNAYADDSEDEDESENESSDSSESSDSKSENHDDDDSHDEKVFHLESSESESHYEDDEDQERALDAVEHQGVKPLREMLTTFESTLSGQVINVELVQNWFRLQYKFTFIDDGGRVRKAYFDAKTGESLD